MDMDVFKAINLLGKLKEVESIAENIESFVGDDVINYIRESIESLEYCLECIDEKEK